MAGFNDSNDIKINVTVDTKDAIESAKALGQAFKDVSKVIGVDFKELSNAAKAFSQAQIAQIKADSNEEVALIRSRSAERVADIKKRTEEFKQGEENKRADIVKTTAVEVQKLREAQDAFKQYQITRRAEIETNYRQELQGLQNTLAAIKETENTKRTELKTTAGLAIQNAKNEAKEYKNASGERIATIRAESANYKAELQKDTKVFQQTEATKRAEIKKTIDDVRLEAAKVRQATAESQLAGAGKAGADVGALASIGKLAAPLVAVKIAGEAVVGSIKAISNSIVGLAKDGERVQALTSAFQTLQKSVGRDPVASIERLRQATQGLISDTELYQKANQAVLLGVPTKLFEESAEAAVKLGRAMGVDAAFALESLSIGLGRQSRLYLDNLGIVVSASEAYSNFARENNILGRELTDTEKRIAFFNESSKKLKEGLASLPPIADDVGTAFRRISSTFQNLSDKFSLGFNQNRDLAGSLNDLNAKARELPGTFERLGGAVAKFFSVLINIPLVQKLTDGLIGLGKAAVEAVDNLLVGSNAAVKNRVQEIPNEIKKAVDDIQFYQNKAVKQPDMLENAINTFNELTKEYGNLTGRLKDLQAEADREVKLKVNTEDIIQAATDTSAFLNTIQSSTQEALGVVKIPGLDPAQLASATAEADALFLSIANGGVKAEEAGVKVKILAEAIAGITNQANLQALSSQLKQVNDELAQSPDSEKLKVDKATFEEKIRLQQESKALNQAERDQIKKFLDERQKQTKAAYDKLSKDTNRLGKATKNVIGDLRKEFEKFGKKARQSLDEAIPTDIQREILELFRNTRLTTAQFAQALGDLAVKAQASGADLEVLRDVVRDLQDQINKGVKPLELKINGPGGAGEDPAKQIEKTVVNIRESLKGIGLDLGEDGAFFGFDLGGLFPPEVQKDLAESIQGSITNGLVNVTQSLVNEDYEQAAREIGATIGAVIGAAIGSYIPVIGTALGAAIGATIGSAIGQAVYKLGKDSPSTRDRKAIDKYFAELFAGAKLAIKDTITAPFDSAIVDITNQAELGIRRISDLSIAGANPAYFQTLSTEAQAAFNGIGIAFSSLLDMSSEQGQLIARALASNVGGSLQNLQVLIQQTGESLEDLSDAVVKAFINAQISIEEAYNSLLQLQNVMEQGIPGAVGDYGQAIQNFVIAIEDESKNAGQFLIDSFRDIGAEAAEATGASFDSVVTQWASRIGLTGDQIQLFFALLARAGITSFEQLQNAGERTIISILAGVRRIKDETITTIDEVNKLPIVAEPPKTSTPRSSSTPKGKSPEQEREERLKKLREEVQKLLRESNEYEKTLERLKNGELSNVQAGAQIIQIRQQIERLLKERNNLEKEYDDLLAKGAKANKKRLAEVAAALDANKKAIDKLTEGTKEGEKVFKKLNISAVIPLIKSANSLGVVSRLIGVDLENTTNILVQGFLRGKLTLQQFNEQLKATQDNLGKGIPNEVGAVTKAFQNLVDAGVQGGAFSVDAFTDIFAEFREKFQQQSSIVREEQRKDLLAALENAKAAQKAAIGPEAALAAQQAVDAAEKALTDFYDTVPTPSLADLRSELEATFGTDEVAKFFRAIDESGLGSFQDLENAGSEAIIKILAKLTELGFKFGETSQEITDTQNGLNDATNAANGNTDAIQAALDLIKQFNEGADALPPAFDKTTEAVGGLNDTLGRLKDGFNDIIEKLAQLDGNEFKNDVVFNIRTTGDTSSKALVEILFGDGEGTTTGTGNGGGSGAPTTTTSTTAAQIARKRRRLGVLQKSGRGNSEEAKRLRREIRELEG